MSAVSAVKVTRYSSPMKIVVVQNLFVFPNTNLAVCFHEGLRYELRDLIFFFFFWRASDLVQRNVFSFAVF